MHNKVEKHPLFVWLRVCSKCSNPPPLACTSVWKITPCLMAHGSHVVASLLVCPPVSDSLILADADYFLCSVPIPWALGAVVIGASAPSNPISMCCLSCLTTALQQNLNALLLLMLSSHSWVWPVVKLAGLHFPQTTRSFAFDGTKTFTFFPKKMFWSVHVVFFCDVENNCYSFLKTGINIGVPLQDILLQQHISFYLTA